jgi:large subunit ribosomal protein L3
MTATRNVKGLLGTKLGMTQVWDENNKLIPVTVVQADSNVITQLRNAEVDGYVAVQIGYGQIDPRKVTKPLAGHFEKAGVTPRRHVVELRTADAAEYELGQELSVELFEAGQKIDVVGTTKGKGFAGVMKRHGFHGVGASHGAHKNHRKPGSIGGASTPSRVFKGMRMAGRMGAVRHTTLNLTVHAVDVEKSLLLIKGAVPGARGQVVFRTYRREGSLVQWLTLSRLTCLQRSSTFRPTCRCCTRSSSHSSLLRARVPTRPRPAPRFPVQVASRSSRRAPVAPVRVPSVLPT